jgi:hypothetical protein
VAPGTPWRSNAASSTSRAWVPASALPPAVLCDTLAALGDRTRRLGAETLFPSSSRHACVPMSATTMAGGRERADARCVMRVADVAAIAATVESRTGVRRAEGDARSTLRPLPWLEGGGEADGGATAAAERRRCASDASSSSSEDRDAVPSGRYVNSVPCSMPAVVVGLEPAASAAAATIGASGNQDAESLRLDDVGGVLVAPLPAEMLGGESVPPAAAAFACAAGLRWLAPALTAAGAAAVAAALPSAASWSSATFDSAESIVEDAAPAPPLDPARSRAEIGTPAAAAACDRWFKRCVKPASAERIARSRT